MKVVISEKSFHPIAIMHNVIQIKTRVLVLYSLHIQEFSKNTPVLIVTVLKHGIPLSLYNTMPFSVFIQAIIKVNGLIVRIVIQMMPHGTQGILVKDAMVMSKNSNLKSGNRK
jgi:hypothetical protein